MKNKKVKITVNGEEFEVFEGDKLLEALLNLGFNIPHACYHKALQAYGSCRLCIVEINVNGEWRIFTSCNVEVKEGMVVRTESEKLNRIRKKLMDLIESDCILCGLCVRVCQTFGCGILHFEYRGINRKVKSLNINSCLGCMSCINVCPRNAIKFDFNEIRLENEILAKPDLRRCRICGEVIGGERQTREIEEKTGIKIDICENCRKQKTAKSFLTTTILTTNHSSSG